MTVNENFTGCQLPYIMIVLILHINLLNLFLIKKNVNFLRNMEPSMGLLGRKTLIQKKEKKKKKCSKIRP